VTVTIPDLPLLIAELEVTSVERLSPTFARIELASPALAELGTSGPSYDQRLKLIFPGASGEPASFEGVDESWFATWMDIPEEERGHMRTYTLREIRGSGADARLVIDFLLHVEPGASGPGSDWAADARPGSRLVTVAPRRGHEFGGIEFLPGSASELLLVGDETAVPAICAILEQLPDDAQGAAFLEVPVGLDEQTVAAPAGVAVFWLPRAGASYGEKLVPAVLGHLGAGRTPRPAVADDEIDPDLWETPAYSSSGEDLDPPVTVRGEWDGLYAWIAGESGVVTALRRALVKDLGIDRRQVAFMGYWRRGVAMRS